MGYTITKYTRGEAPVAVCKNLNGDISDENYKRICSHLREQYNNGIFITTNNINGMVIDMFANISDFVPYPDPDTNVPQPNDSHPDKIWMSMDDIPEFFGEDECERFKRWMNFYNNGIIFYKDN